MKHFLFILIAVVLAVTAPLATRGAEDPPRLLIVELQTASIDSASDEFVEIYNPNNEAIAVEGWVIQYKSATGSDWLTKATLSGELPARTRHLIATSAYEASIEMKSGLAAGGGHIRIADNLENTVDLLGWGTAAGPEGVAASAPEQGQSLKRIFDEDGFFLDSGDNLAEFTVSLTPTPQFDEIPIPEPEPEPVADPGQTGSADSPSSSARAKTYLPLVITELFVDPDKPLTDAEDEFVELYNPNSTAVDLAGYIIETGATYSYSFTLPAYQLPPKSYVALFSADTSLTLSNTAGRARLLNPAESVLYESEPYENAKTGKSWAQSGGQWVWAEPTPGKSNAQATAAAESQLTDRSELVASVLSESAGDDGEDDESTDERTTYQEPDTATSSELNNTILAGVGSMALLYAGYEYRHDVGNRVHQLKQYVRNRRQNRQSP